MRGQALQMRKNRSAVDRKVRPPLPGLRLPEGTAPPAVTPRESLPEGGFGWFLIRALTERLDYARADGENRLTLHFGPGTGPDLRR